MIVADTNVIAYLFVPGDRTSAAEALRRRDAECAAPLEFAVDSETVLELAAGSGCSACDCEFVALAEYLDVPLVSADQKLKTRFGKRVRLLS